MGSKNNTPGVGESDHLDGQTSGGSRAKLARDVIRSRTPVWAMITGKATMQKRLKGKILTAKEEVLDVGFNLFTAPHQENGDPIRDRDDEVIATRTRFDWFNANFDRFKNLIDFKKETTTTEPFGPIHSLQRLVSTERGSRVTATRKEKWETEREKEEGEDHTPMIELSPRVDDTGSLADIPPFSEDFLDIPPKIMWAVTAMRLLNAAEENLGQNTETAYRAYWRAERYLVAGKYLLYQTRTAESKRNTPVREETDSENPIQAHARLVYDEAVANARDGAVLGAVEELLCEESECDEIVLKDDLSLAELDNAMGVLNKRRMEEYRQFENYRKGIFGFLAISGVLLGGILVLFPAFMSDSLPESIANLLPALAAGTPLPESIPRLPERVFFVLILVFGALGAAISGIRHVERDPVSVRATDKMLGMWLPVVRMTIGAISAFIVSIFLFSGVINETVLSIPLVLGMSLAAGFSERLVIRAISSFERRAMPDASNRWGEGMR